MNRFPSRISGAARTFAAIAAAALLMATAAPSHAVETYDARVTLLKNHEYLDELLNSVRNARKSIVFSYYIFKAKGNNDPGRVAEELVRAQKRGADVTVILERTSAKDKLNEENLHTAAILARGGVKVFFDSPDVVTHMKVAIIDARYVFVGSHNLTESALMHNNELSVMIDSPSLARDVKTYLNQL
jgi:phosphatidylserine/phosphatidylglycerophosphate/cardiolipin synthase-like enzyme